MSGTVNSAVVSSVFEVRPGNHLYGKPLPLCALNQKHQQKRWLFEPSVNSPVTAGQLKFEPFKSSEFPRVRFNREAED